MNLDKLLFRVEYLGHPQRCQGTIAGKGGQCEYYSMAWLIEQNKIEPASVTDTSKLVCCPRHGGYNQIRNEQKQTAHAYRLQVWAERVNEFANEDATNLRGEIGICRMMLENILNLCDDTHQLMIYSPRVMQLVDRVEKLVRSCAAIEAKSGMMMDKSAALAFASDAVKIISQHVQDPTILDDISNGLIDALKQHT